MKFKKEMTIVVEGEIYDDSLTPEEVLKSLKWSYLHWWERNSTWTYGKPSPDIQGGRVDRITFDGIELK